MKRIVKNFLFFYKYLKLRIFVIIGLSILTGLLDGLGITMFLPLIESEGNFDDSKNQHTGDGALKLVFGLFSKVGFEMNLLNILILILIIIILKSIIIFINSVLRVSYLQFFTKKLRFQSIDLLSQLNFQHFVSFDSGVIQNSFSGEVSRVVSCFTEYVSMIQNVILAMIYVVFAYIINAEFALLILFGSVVFNFIYSFFFKRTKRLSSRLVMGNDSYQKLLLQLMSYYKYLKATSSIYKYTEYLKSEIRNIEIINKRQGVINSLIGAIREPLLYSVVISVIIIQVNVNHVPLSGIMISLILFYRGLGIVINIQTNYNSFLSFAGSLDKTQSLIEDLSKNKLQSGNKRFDQFKTQIEVNQLVYRYKNGKDVLCEISFNIQRNETIALVGESGSGKSTLVNLLSGLLTPTAGSISIDGIQINQYNTESLQSKIGYITQDPVIFDDTIFNNVTLWAEKNEKNLEKYEVALKQASIWDYFKDSEIRENTRLGNKGVRLSGGQIQRICIARELYKSVDFLFMDEATSALDSKTENIVKKNIEDLQGLVTIIIVAHRLSTIKHADKIIVMNKGKIEGIGKFDELIKSSELFRSMISLQELKSE